MIEHKDRIPGVGKANRKLITPEGGAAFYATVEYADDPIDVGTPINKALLDEFLTASGTTSGTATALTLAQPGFSLFVGATVRFQLHVDIVAGATLNVENTGAKPLLDVELQPFADCKAGSWITAIYNGNAWIANVGRTPIKVGDIVYTIRNNLGNKFLLCNGACYDVYQYPQLANVDLNPTTYGIMQGVGATTFTDVVYGNGYYAVRSNSTIYYATSLTGPWTSKTFSFTVSRLRFLNGYFAVVGQGTTSDGKIYVAYASTPNQTWTTVTVTTLSTTNLSSFAATDICWTGYHYGILVSSLYVVPSYGAAFNINLYYSTSINATYTAKALYSGLTSDTGSTSFNFAVGNNYCAAYCRRYDTDGIKNGIYYINSTNLSGSWSWIELGTSSSASAFFNFLNGKFIFTGWDAAASKTRVHIGNTPTSLSIAYETNTSYSAIGGTYGNGYYFIFLYDSNATCCLYSANGANWALYTILAASMTSGNFFDETYGALLTYNNNIYYDRYPMGSHKQLPTISIPGAYAYIRSAL